MMKNSLFLLLLLVTSLVTSCARHYPEIVLLSERPTAHPDSMRPPMKPSLSATQIRQIEQVVFERLLNGHFGDDGSYTAVFLQADESQTKVLQEKFPQHQPTIKQLWHADIRAGFTPLDKDTGKPAIIFSCEIGEPDGSWLTALARWYAGEAVKGFYLVTFHQNSQGWSVVAD